jgi:hypothetical protein
VTDGDGQLELVRQLLELNFPQTDTISVAATTVSRNHEALGVRVTLLSHGQCDMKNEGPVASR